MKQTLEANISFWALFSATILLNHGARALLSTHSNPVYKVTSARTFAVPSFVNQNFDNKQTTLDRSYRSQLSASIASTELANHLLAEAERFRLEAERLDRSLTTQKIEALERKLSNENWLRKHPGQRQVIENQLSLLRGHSSGSRHTASFTSKSFDHQSYKLDDKSTAYDKSAAFDIAAVAEDLAFAESVKNEPEGITFSETKIASTSITAEEPLIAGFDNEDLALYIPVARAIEKKFTSLPSSDTTMAEMLVAFREAPELQEHFKSKMQSMMSPMEDMQKLDELRNRYLYTDSSMEKAQLKRQIEEQERLFEIEGPFSYSESVYKGIPALTKKELQERLEAASKLPIILQVLFKEHCGLEERDDLSLAIQLDHYEEQLQLLHQVRFYVPMEESTRQETIQAIESLPAAVRDHLMYSLGTHPSKNAVTVEEIFEALIEGADDPTWSSLKQVIEATSTPDLPEYSDIAFIDRSRHIDDFYPSIARLEGHHPTQNDIDLFLKHVLDQKTFLVHGKPERVIGGYYIRGNNCLLNDDGGEKMVVTIQNQLETSTLKDRVQFYYINDPAPLSEELVELGCTAQPLLLVTRKDENTLHKHASGFNKGLVSALALSGLAIFALGTCELQPSFIQNSEVSRDIVDFSRLAGPASLVLLSTIAIQAAHDIGHRIIAWRDKFSVGLSTLIPSIHLGTFGTITPLKSPPPTLRSLFDFSMSGPVVGMLTSIAFLVAGLSMTASMDLDQIAELPAVPSFVLRLSSLGGGLVELFLGNGVLSQELPSAGVIPLHPFAISGFLGVFGNALALLPLGNTDGGRIALAMFGRRGTYLVKTFTALFLCSAGLFGFDESKVFLAYALFTLLWQKDLETPARNEVEEMDCLRGVLGITSALLVALILIPMQ